MAGSRSAARASSLAYRTFDKLRQVDQGAIADNKRLAAVLTVIRNQQLRRGPQRRSGSRRRDQRNGPDQPPIGGPT
jgi:hypothetical protein